MFKVLVACEESQRVTLYLRERERERERNRGLLM